MTARELERQTAHRLGSVRHAEEVTGSELHTYRTDGHGVHIGFPGEEEDP